MLTAYQEGLVTLPQLRQRMPALQKQANAVESELQSLEMAAVDVKRIVRDSSSYCAAWPGRTRIMLVRIQRAWPVRLSNSSWLKER